MPKIVCPKGRTRILGGKQVKVWHKADGSDCPLCSKENQVPSPATEVAKPEAKPTEAKPAETPPAKKPGVLRRLGFGSRETAPEVPVAPPKNQPPEFHVDAKHTIEFANLIYGGARWVADLLDKFLLTEEAGGKRFTREHPELLRLSDFEKEAITLDPQSDLWGRFATGFCKMVGAKTQAQAHAAIDTLSFIGHFGALLAFATDHYWHAYQDGKPFRAARKAAKKAQIAARQRPKEVKVPERTEPAREGGTVPAVGQPAIATAS